MKEEQYSPNKRSKTTLSVLVEGQGERGREGQPFERTQELVDSRTSFRIVTVDGGKTLDIELPLPKFVYNCKRRDITNRGIHKATRTKTSLPNMSL